MMPEISLNILDVAQNSVKAGAKLTKLSCLIDTKADTLTVIIEDDGCGMTKEQVEENAKTYFEQMSKVLDVSQAEVVNNADWLHKGPVL